MTRAMGGRGNELYFVKDGRVFSTPSGGFFFFLRKFGDDYQNITDTRVGAGEALHCAWKNDPPDGKPFLQSV